MAAVLLESEENEKREQCVVPFFLCLGLECETCIVYAAFHDLMSPRLRRRRDGSTKRPTSDSEESDDGVGSVVFSAFAHCFCSSIQTWIFLRDCIPLPPLSESEILVKS